MACCIFTYVLYSMIAIIVSLFISLYSSLPFRQWFFAKLFTARFMESLWVMFIEHRKSWLKDLTNVKNSSPGTKLTLLEIGVGEGRNFDFYPNNTKLIALDYNVNFRSAFEKNIVKHPKVELVEYMQGDIQNMHQIGDNSVDVVLVTHVLCSVPDVTKALAEVKRVLKPNGHFFFFEHVGYRDHPSTKICIMALFQKFLHPVWKIIMGGCQINNTHYIDFEKAGFSKLKMEMVYPDNLPFPFRPHIWGSAQK